jgi:uncharacterized protein (UPF0333 family)
MRQEVRMIYVILVLVALLILAIVVAYFLGKAWRKARADATAAQAEAIRIESVYKHREEINAEAQRKKDSMSTGTDRDKFDASLDVLHDASGGKPPAG